MDVATNVKEELPGSFLFQNKLLSAEQYENYLKKCFKPKTNQWVLANTEIQLSTETLSRKRHDHFRNVLANINFQTTQGSSFHKLPNFPQTQPIISTLELFLVLSSRLTIEQIKEIKPELNEPSTQISVIKKEIPKRILNDDQEGLFTVVQHNGTLKEVLESSFLEQDKIYQALLAFECAGLIRTESTIESEKRNFFGSLTEEQKRNRLEVKKEFQRLAHVNFYDALGIDKDVDTQDIKMAFDKVMIKYASPSHTGLFFEKEEDLTNFIVQKLQNAFATLSHPERKKEYDAFISKGQAGDFLDQSQTLQEDKIVQDFNKIVKERKFDIAIQFLLKEISEHPTYLKLYSALVMLVQEMKITKNEQLNQKIFSAFKDGISKSPQEGRLFVWLGDWCLLLEQKTNALKAYQKAIHLNPGSITLRKNIVTLDPKNGKQLVVEAIFQNLENLNHFEILGLEASATHDMIREAYRDASRYFHPDHFYSSDNESLKEMAKRVFKEIVSSHMVLKDDRKRKELVESMFASKRKIEDKQKSVVPKNIQAKKYYDEAVKFIKSGNLTSAKLNIQLALSYEPENYLLQKMLKDAQAK